MGIGRSLRCLGTAGAIIAGCLCPALNFAARDEDVVSKSPPAPQDDARAALDVLLQGDPASRREAAEKAVVTFQSLDTTPCEDADFREILETLRRIIRTEKDDWIASRLLQNLGGLKTDCLNPLDLDALESRSPNLRWRAIQWFAEHEDPAAIPLLEDAWRIEERPWVRVDLLGALAKNGGAGHARQLLDAAGHGSPSLSRAAFEALQTLGDSGIAAEVARLAREGEGPVRPEAVSTLASWPDSDEALTALLDLTADEEQEPREGAIAALGKFKSPRAVEKALDLVKRGNREGDRSAALSALESLRPPEAVPVLADLLHESLPEESSGLTGEAIWILYQLDDPAAIPMLRDLDPELGGPGFFNVRGLVESLSREPTTSAGRIVWTRLSCGAVALVKDPENPAELEVVPPGGRLTIRCWEFPGVAGDPEDFLRVFGGVRGRVQDHYEGGDDAWVEIEAPAFSEDCWVPRHLLQPVSRENDDAGPAQTPGREELDLPEEELRSEPGRSLAEAGLFKVIEPGDAVVGLSLEADPEDEEGLAILMRSCRNDDSILDDAIQDVLRSLGLSCPDRADTASPDDPDSPDEEAATNVDPASQTTP